MKFSVSVYVYLAIGLIQIILPMPNPYCPVSYRYKIRNVWSWEISYIRGLILWLSREKILWKWDGDTLLSLILTILSLSLFIPFSLLYLSLSPSFFISCSLPLHSFLPPIPFSLSPFLSTCSYLLSLSLFLYSLALALSLPLTHIN